MCGSHTTATTALTSSTRHQSSAFFESAANDLRGDWRRTLRNPDHRAVASSLDTRRREAAPGELCDHGSERPPLPRRRARPAPRPRRHRSRGSARTKLMPRHCRVSLGGVSAVGDLTAGLASASRPHAAGRGRGDASRRAGRRRCFRRSPSSPARRSRPRRGSPDRCDARVTRR
jgi:hypothetical protein